MQTVSLRHFGGGNEVQVVTFGPGYSAAPAIAPLTSAINAVPSATSRGGAEQDGNTVTIATATAHTLQPGDVVTIAGVARGRLQRHVHGHGRPDDAVVPVHEPDHRPARSRAAARSRPAVPGASSSGTTATIRTTVAHNRSVGDVVTIAGVGVAGYNGTVTITAVPTPRTFQYTLATPRPRQLRRRLG